MSKSKKSAAARSAEPPPKRRRSARGGESSSESAPTSSADDAEPGPSFESALEQLESTVGRLEAGELPLEQALELFESGVRLSRQCTATLEAAERRIEILVADRADADGWRAEPFESADSFESDEDEDDGDDDDEDVSAERDE